MKPTTKLVAILLLFSATFCLQAALTDGLVCYWPLDTTNLDGTTPDLSFGNSLTAVAGPLVGPGQTGTSNAMTFNGTRYLGLTNAANSGALFPNAFSSESNGLPIWRAGTYSILFWVKGAAQTAKFVFTEGNTNNTGPIFILQTGQAAANNAKLDAILRGDSGAVYINHAFTASAVFDNNWHHVAWVDNRGKVSIYVDGNLDANSATFNYTYQDGGLTLNTLGIAALLRTTVAASFSGSMDEVALWERTLSQAEVNQVRTGGVYTPGTAVPPRGVSFIMPPDPTKHVGDWNIFRIKPIGNRPIGPSQWSKNGVPLLDGTNRTYLVTGLTTNNNGDAYSVTASNNFSATVSSASNILTVLPDPTPAPLSGLVNYWPMDSYDANTNSPELHFGQNMLMFNMDTNSQIVAGQFSNAVFCIGGLPTYGMKIAGPPIYNASNYSVAIWVNANGVGQSDRRVFSEGSTLGNNQLWSLGTDNTGITPSATVFVRSDAGTSSEINGRKSARTVFDGNWHHLVWTDASGQGKLYVDGTLDETDYTYIRPQLTLNLTEIGAAARAPLPVNPITGNLDDVATWNRVLSWTEIQQIMTNGVPTPPSVTAPTIVAQPQNLTNGDVYVTDTVTFSAQENGTLPLDFHWLRNGSAINGGLNPSALTDSLVLTNVQLSDSNTTYSLIITNAAGSVTSSVVRLYVKSFTPVTNGIVLSSDVDLTGGPDIQPGFSEFTLGGNPALLANALKMTISGIGTSLAERHRLAPPDARSVFNNPPFMTQAQIYNDFIFANNSTLDGTGLRVLLEHLAPNTPYGVVIWSFDPISTPLRLSDWSETSTDTPVPIQTGFSFDGAVLPTGDFDYTLGGLLTSSPLGKLQIDGLRDGGTSFGVFVNGIRLEANPVAHTRILWGQFVNGNLRIAAVGQYPGQTISLLQSTDSVKGPWVPAVGGTPVSGNSMVQIIDFPVDVNQPQIFYWGGQ